jgi:hypothetical protein
MKRQNLSQQKIWAMKDTCSTCRFVRIQPLPSAHYDELVWICHREDETPVPPQAFCNEYVSVEDADNPRR